MLSEGLSTILFISILIQLFYIRSLIRLNNCLLQQYKVNINYFYLYPLSIVIYYIYFVTGTFKYSDILNAVFMLGMPLLSFLALITTTLYLLWGSKKTLDIFNTNKKCFALDAGGLGLYIFVIALFLSTYLANYTMIALFIVAAITHWMFIKANYKFLNKNLHSNRKM